MKKDKLFAPFLMLFAGAVASIMMFCFHYTSGQMLPRLLAVLLIFYTAGWIIQNRVSAFVSRIRAEEEIRRKEAEAAAAEENAEKAAEIESSAEKEEPEPDLGDNL